MAHVVEISITKMVGNRLPFLDIEDAGVLELISNYIVEVMYQLEPCLKVNVYADDGTVITEHVGDEDFYSLPKKALIADIVTINLLLTQIGNNMNGSSSSTTASTAAGVFLKKAKAGSSEVEYDQFNVKNAASFGLAGVDVSKLIDMYMKQAMMKGKKLGCLFCFEEGCLSLNSIPGDTAPFIISKGTACGCA